MQREKETLSERLRKSEAAVVQAQNEREVLAAKNEALAAELLSLKAQFDSTTSQQEQQKRDVTSLEESLAKKTKDIYDLTVQLGSLKEENHQLRRDQEDLRTSFEERINDVKERTAAEYAALQEEY